MSEEDVNDESVFDEDLVRELGLDPADLQGGTPIKKEKKPISPTAKSSLENIKKATADAASIQEPVFKSPKPQPAPPRAPLDRQSPPVVPKPLPEKPPVEFDDDLSLRVSKNIPVQLAAVIAKKSVKLSDLLELKKGEVVDFKKTVQEPLDLVANGKLIAKAELVLIDGKIGARIVKLVK